MIPTSKDFSTSSGLKAGEKHAAQGIKSVGNGSTGSLTLFWSPESLGFQQK